MAAQLIAWLNEAAGVLAAIVLAPIAWMPGWLSATLIAAVTGVLMLIVFKHTSNQAAIKRARNQIKANLLSLSLFKDSALVGLRAQGRILLGAGKLILLSIVPMLVMLVPMSLLLGQLALWYQARPLRAGEEAVVTVELAESAGGALGEVKLSPSAGVAGVVGPVRVPAKSMVCWDIRAGAPGLHDLSFEIGGQSFHKELRVGDGFVPTSLKRPPRVWSEMLLHPRERPFPADSPVQSIDIVYPERASLTAGTDSWLVYWFIVSLVAAFAARPLLKVQI
jgi:hypothetical protein